MTERFSKKERIQIAKKGSLTAFYTLIIFSILGSVIFKFFGITLEAFQIMGGILFFRNGLRMLEAKVGRSRTTPAEQEESFESEDIAISPIGIPLIAGPGAITAVMLLSSQTPQIYSYATVVLSLFLVLLLVYFEEWRCRNKSTWYNRNENYSKVNGTNTTCYCCTICNKWYYFCFKAIILVILF